jgi:hypothetical protein
VFVRRYYTTSLPHPSASRILYYVYNSFAGPPATSIVQRRCGFPEAAFDPEGRRPRYDSAGYSHTRRRRAQGLSNTETANSQHLRTRSPNMEREKAREDPRDRAGRAYCRMCKARNRVKGTNGDVLASSITSTEINWRSTRYLSPTTKEACERLNCASDTPWLWRAAADHTWACICGRIFSDRGGRTRQSSRPRPPLGRLRCLGVGGWFYLRFGMKHSGRLIDIGRQPARTW